MEKPFSVMILNSVRGQLPLIFPGFPFSLGIGQGRPQEGSAMSTTGKWSRIYQGIRQAVPIVLLAAVIGVLYNTYSVNGIPLIGQWGSGGAGSAGGNKGPVGKAPEINLQQAIKFYEKGQLLVDARPEDEWKEGHIAKATWLPIWELEKQGEKFLTPFLATVPKNRLVITYCNGGDCEDSHFLAEDLMKAGYTNVMVYAGGYPEWQKAGQPAAKEESK